MINTYECVSKPQVKDTIPIQVWLDQIKKSKYSDLIISARNGITCYDTVKKILPCTTFNFLFKGFKNDKNIIKPTGFIYIDVDSKDFNINTINKKKVFSYYKSFGGKGYAIIVKVKNIDINNFKETYIGICKDLNIIDFIDINAIKKTQYNILSYDEDIYINLDSEEFNSNNYTLSDTNLAPTKLIKEKKDPLQSLLHKKEEDKRVYRTVMGLKLGRNKKKGFQNIRYNNIDELSKKETEGISYKIDWEGYDYVECYVPKKKILKGNRNNSLLSYINNLVWLNPELSINLTIKIISNVNTVMFVEPLSKNEIFNAVKSVFEYKNNGLLKPIYSKRKRKFLFNSDSGYSMKDKLEIVASEVNKKRVDNSKQKIYSFIENWDFKKEGKISQVSLQKVSSMNIKTIKKYYPQFKQYISELNQQYKQNL